MKPTLLGILLAFLIVGCTAAQMQRLGEDEARAEALLAAATQATAAAKATLATRPADAPGRDDAKKVIDASEKGEQTSRLALDVARAALNAAKNRDAADPALAASLTAAIVHIPSPWTPVLASLVPAALPLVVSVMQSVKLGRAHQTVLHVTEQLEAHKAALDAITRPEPVRETTDHLAGLPV